jgi:hypothetical protein
LEALALHGHMQREREPESGRPAIAARPGKSITLICRAPA